MSSNRSGPSLGTTRASAVAEELRRLILAGEIQAGARLRQVELAERFNVSTTPVREAFTVLAREGFLRHDAQRGVVVFSPTPDDIRENYEIRIALEPLAAEIAARGITDGELRQLDDMLARMSKVKRQLDYQRLNREFHRTIYRAARRPRLLELIESLRDAFEAYIRFDAVMRPSPQYRDTAHTEHEAILQALHSGAPDAAAKRMKEHLTNNASHYLNTFDASA
jgi:DNA-binding GntR family transcriptional regulator